MSTTIVQKSPKKVTVSAALKRAFTPVRLAAAVMVLVFILVMILAPLIAPADPLEQNIAMRFAPLGTPGYLLGADELGRDVLSRVIFGIRTELLVALSATLVAMVIGTVLGLVAGYFGGIIETLSMRGVDVILAFPPIIIALLATTLYGPGPGTLIAVMGVLFIPAFARIVYGQTLSVGRAEFVEASEVFGARVFVRLFRVILPNVIAPVFVQFSLTMATAILLESGLSYLGLGIVPPAPSLGTMVAEGQRYMSTEPAALLVPGTIVSLTILGFSLLGDALRDWLDPRR
ncbi:ABC transporter permease [Crystallibacter degradans]|uniref:ABC transporter permease n=1 Tax=Crystallibacter degradans TaxID=2726743 RepID=UPI0014767547|nr:ABC transporter permease [Arthrobacter sp. SF27]NMR32247.1 ABC transporter permease [Arthrobacter sp. SF27]